MPLYVTKTEITIGKFVFDFCCEVKINSSYKNLTDTAKIVIPKKLAWQNTPLTKGETSPLKRGMPVKIRLGYGEEMPTEFEGYVTKIGMQTPLEIECEDKMWFLKQSTITSKIYANVSLSTLLKDILPAGIEYVCNQEIQLGKFRISKATPAMVLDELKKTYLLYSFFRGGKLYVGQAFWLELRKEHKLDFVENIVDGGKNLSFQKAEDTKIKVKAISMLPNNTKIEIEEGDPDGATRTLHYYNKSEALLRQIAKTEIETLKYTGLSGKVEALGLPSIQHGDYVTFFDENNEDRDGDTYRIEAVEIGMGMSGYRRTCTIDKLVKKN